MKVSSAHFIPRRTAIIGWLTLFTQAALPLSFAYSPLVHAATSQDNASKWYQSGANGENGQSIFENHGNSLAAAGSALTESNAAGIARSAATGAVNSSVEGWLSQFGTARVQLNLDDKFKAEGSEADLLVPVYEDKNNILFTQLGFRHKDDRNTGNLGVGVRHFTGDWMLGANTFYDNDFSGNNRRMGVGVEAWRDYLKLSANSYIRLSDWHQSRDFEDYDERPANGYDLRAEGWLPAFPQLGAKVMFEKYQGDEVALFGKDNRQKDPWAFTGGVTYTPIPLLTVGAQHRAGKDGQNDSQLSLQMNYRLGESWSKQVDPNLVGASRTLNGTRYDLVERNNNIVLDYRKQEVVKLVLPEKTTGKSRSTVPVTFDVQSKHPLQRIDWDTSALVAAGGAITQVSNNQLSVTLPPYQAAGSNVYRFAGVAYDVKGNSGSASAEIHVDVGDVLPSATKVSANPTTLAADGKSTSTLSIALFDDQGNPVSGMVKSLKATLQESLSSKQPATQSAVQAATVGPVEEASPGVYQAIITAGTRIGTATVSSTFNDIALPDVAITQSADAATGHIESGAMLTAVDNSVANNAAMNQINATITDAGGNPLPNTKVTFSVTGSATVVARSSMSAITDDQGMVSINLVDKVAETVTVTATLDNGNSGSIDSHFIADSSTASIANSDIGVDKQSVVANNVDMATFKAVVKDANSNLVPNFTVNWTNDKGNLSANSSTTDSNGEATVTLKHTVAEAAQVVVQAGSSSSVNAPIVNFTADSGNLSTANSSLAATPATIVANGTTVSTVTLSLKDVNNNVVSGQPVTFSSNLGGSNFGSVTDNGDGTYTAQFTGITAGAASITANIGGIAFGVASVNVTLTADSNNLSTDKSAMTASPASIVADGTSASTITLSLKDANNNAVSGQTVVFSSTLGNVGSVTDNSDGTYSAQLTSTAAGTATISTTIGGNAFGVTAANVALTADSNNLSTTNSSLAATPATIVANGTTASTITLTLKDVNNNPVSGLSAGFVSSLSNSSVGNVTDHGDGTYTALLTGTTAGTASITTTIGGSGFGVTAANVTLTADSSNLSTANSSLAATPATIVADGTAASTITLSLKDANNNAVSGQTVAFSNSLANSNIGTVTDNGDGTYTAQLTGTTAGTATISTSVGGNAFGVTAANVTLTADSNNLSTANSTLTASTPSIVANGTQASTITLTLKDANNNLVSGQTVTFNSSLADGNFGTVADNGDGTYTAAFTGTKAGSTNVTANVGGNAFGVTAATVTLTADSSNLSTVKSTLAASVPTIVANGTAASTITLTLKDVNDNLVSGQAVTFSSSVANSSFGTVTDNNNGTYTASFTGITAGAASITANVGGTPFGVTATTVTLTADSSNPSTAKSTLTASVPTIVANGTAASTITLTLKDANDNLISGQTISYSSSVANGSFTTTQDHGDGTYTAQFTGTTSGAANITAKIGATAFNVTPAAVTLIGDTATAKVITLVANVNNLIGNGAGQAVYTATVHDAHGNLVEGADITWTATSGNMSSATSQTNSSGQATSTLSGITRTAATNTTATVTATAVAGNRPATITVRTTILSGGKYYWSMVNLNTSVLATAQANCALYGGGRVFEESDVTPFDNGGGDFDTKSTGDGEYTNDWFRLADKWDTKSIDLYGNVGFSQTAAGVRYVCVR